MSLLVWPLRHRHVVIVLCTVVAALGLRSLLVMPRQDTPSISIHQALVIAQYPGASAAQVEQQLTRPLESYLFSYTEVDATKTHSITRDGLMVITVELREWVPDMAGFWSRLRLGLAEQKVLSLPTPVLGPLVNSDFGDSVAMLVAVSSPQRSYAELRGDLDRLEEAIRNVPGAGRIRRLGNRGEAIYVEADSRRLAVYQAGLPQVIAALQLQNTTSHTGSLKTADLEVPLHTRGRISTVEEVRSQVVVRDPTGERLVRVGDVAEVERRLETPTSFLRVNGTEDTALLLSIEMQPGHNIVTFGEEVRAAIDAVAERLPADLKYTVINDQPGVVDEAVTHFVREFFIAVGAVVAVTLLLLPIRVALIAAMAIPVTIAFTFFALEMLGIELHEVSLAALIVVLGMVVDDAIVIADNYLEKLDEGMSRWEAAWRAAGELTVPVFTATIAIVLAFAPLGVLLTGSVGEFIVALPITVAIALLTSFVVAMLFTPLLCHGFIRRGLKDQPASLGAKVLDGVQRLYDPVVRRLVAHPRLTVLGALLSLVAGVALIGAIRLKFFPAAERAQFVIEVDMPLGTRLEATDAVVRDIETLLAADERVTDFAAFVGTPAPRVYYSFAPEFPRSSYGMLLVGTPGPADTEALVRDYAAKLHGSRPGARIAVTRFQQGIPVKAPVEVRVIGPDLPTLRRLGDQVKGIVAGAPGATEVRDDFRDGFSIDLDLHSEVASRLGFYSGVVAREVMAGFSGLPVTEVWENDEPLPIVLQLDEANREDFNDLKDIVLRAPFGLAHVPLQQVADVNPVWAPVQIARRNGARTLTVRADAEGEVLPSEILSHIAPAVRQLALPPGYRIELGGEYEGQMRTFGQMAGALGASVALIYLVLLFQFKNSREVLLVMLAIPLTFFGAMLGLVITRNPLGFTAAVGLISLVGIVIRNSIILVDHADELRRREGFDAPEAAIHSGQRRLRPIFLTSMAAAVGVLPMIISGSPLWAPLASVFSVGILWSMVMTLLVVPAVYGATMKNPPAVGGPNEDAEVSS